jgi:hypothetical protein
MVEKDAVSKDFRKQVLGYGLTLCIVVLIVTGACKATLAELRSVPEFSGAEGFSGFLGDNARWSALCGHRRAVQTDQACRTTRRGWSLPAALTRGRRALR